MGAFNYCVICWEENTAVHRQPSKLLDWVTNTFLVQVVERPTMGGESSSTLVTHKQGWGMIYECVGRG